MHKMEFTVTDLARIAGANPRSVQHWAASRILSPNPHTDRAGTGTRRLFSADEAVVACIMQPLLERQTPVGEMLRIALVVRGELLVGLGGRRRILDHILHGRSQGWLVIFPEQDDPVAMLLQRKSVDSFAEVFAKMKNKAVALVIDLTAALKGLRSELGGH
jgi:hypothetical protein